MINYIYKEFTMSNRSAAEKIVVAKTINHIKQYSSKMVAVARKLLKEHPRKASKFSHLLERIDEANIIAIEPIEHEILQSKNIKKCLNYMIQVGNQAEIVINADLTELKSVHESLPAEEQKSLYHLNYLLISLYQHGIGYLYKEAKNILYAKPNKNTM